MEGTVLRSINNIYSVRSGKSIFLCRIKGKQLSQAKGEYNPIVCGDSVVFEQTGTDEGLVISRNPRRSEFSRWNAKVQNNQTVCANMDMVVCVCSVESPPFRPRFIDRVLACCRNVDILICMNKSDILLTDDEFERFSLYSKLGYSVLSVSAQTGENLEGLKKMLFGKVSSFVGQSGVGKSSLVNAILGSCQRVGQVSAKYNRGCHTTNYAAFLDGDDFSIIDTPGFREISVPHDSIRAVADSFPEIREAAAKCEYDSCTHTGESGCEVARRVEEGIINSDRYSSYLRIVEGLDDRRPVWGRNVQKNI